MADGLRSSITQSCRVSSAAAGRPRLRLRDAFARNVSREREHSIKGDLSHCARHEDEQIAEVASMKGLEETVAVVTGGNSGIGLATARRLQEEGARVAIAGRNAESLRQAAQAIGNGVLAIQTDVATLPELDKLYATVAQELGRIDVLFVNAGVTKFVPLVEMSESIYDELFDIDTKGAYFTIQKALPHLNDGASIILNTSVADKKGRPGTSAYSAAKAALRSFARTMRWPRSSLIGASA